MKKTIMRRSAFYFTFGLITFSVSLIACALWKVNKTESEDFERTKSNVTVPKQSAEKAEELERIVNDCFDDKIKPFWDKLDKEAFLRFKKNQAEVSKNYNEAFFQAQWERLSEKFTCKYFSDIEQKDLNDDGEEEIFAKGELTSNLSDREVFVFRSENGKLKPVLFDDAGSFIEPTGKKFNRFSEILIKSGYSGRYGGRRINRYRFNGKFYETVKCVFKYDWDTDINGKTTYYRKPRVEVEECDSENYFLKNQ